MSAAVSDDVAGKKPASARPARWETADLAWFTPPPREVQAYPKSYEGPDVEQEIG